MPPAIDLARRYAEALAALRAVHAFDAWLGCHWHERCPTPDSPAMSHTPLGAGNAITWFEAEETVFGFLPGEEGCFRIPRAAVLPDFPFVTDATALPPGQDVVISAAMREEIRPQDG